jgi:hypothetical protein
VRTVTLPVRRVIVGSWIMILVLTVGLVILYTDNKRTRECIANYMVADQRNTQARADIAEQERQAFLVTMQKIFNPETSPQERKKAGDDYIALVVTNNELRKKSPVLPVPTECN